MRSAGREAPPGMQSDYEEPCHAADVPRYTHSPRDRLHAGSGGSLRHQPGHRQAAARARVGGAGNRDGAAGGAGSGADARFRRTTGAPGARAARWRAARSRLRASEPSLGVPRRRRPDAERVRAPRGLHLRHARDGDPHDLGGAARQRARARDRACHGPPLGDADLPAAARAARAGPRQHLLPRGAATLLGARGGAAADVPPPLPR